MMMQAQALAGFAPHERGLYSPHSFVHVIHWAARGYACYPSHGDGAIAGAKAAATTDLALLRRLYDDDPNTDWRVRALPSDGLIVLKFPRQRDLEFCESEFGKLPSSRQIVRDGGARYHLFARAIASPEFRVGSDIAGTRAQMKDSAPITASIHRPTGERWRWREGCGMDATLAHLPRAWLVGLPKKVPSITAQITERPEWRPHTPLWTND